MTIEGWLPPEGDVHLRIWLAGMVFDYTATAVAVRNFIHDWLRKPRGTIELVHDIADHPPLRLPNERLFLGP